MIDELRVLEGSIKEVCVVICVALALGVFCIILVWYLADLPKITQISGSVDSNIVEVIKH